MKQKLKLKYDSQNRIARIDKRISGQVKSQDWSRFNYEKDSYKVSWGSGKFWYTSDEYFFDSERYLLKKIQESDYQPSIVLYEYEPGKGNAISFIYYLHDFMYHRPLIY